MVTLLEPDKKTQKRPGGQTAPQALTRIQQCSSSPARTRGPASGAAYTQGVGRGQRGVGCPAVAADLPSPERRYPMAIGKIESLTIKGATWLHSALTTAPARKSISRRLSPPIRLCQFWRVSKSLRRRALLTTAGQSFGRNPASNLARLSFAGGPGSGVDQVPSPVARSKGPFRIRFSLVSSLGTTMTPCQKMTQGGARECPSPVGVCKAAANSRAFV